MRATGYGSILCLYEFIRVTEIGETAAMLSPDLQGENMTVVRYLPCEVEAVFREFRTGE